MVFILQHCYLLFFNAWSNERKQFLEATHPLSTTSSNYNCIAFTNNWALPVVLRFHSSPWSPSKDRSMLNNLLCPIIRVWWHSVVTILSHTANSKSNLGVHYMTNPMTHVSYVLLLLPNPTLNQTRVGIYEVKWLYPAPQKNKVIHHLNVTTISIYNRFSC